MEIWCGVVLQSAGGHLYKSLLKVTHPSQKPIYWDVIALELFSLLSSGQKYSSVICFAVLLLHENEIGPRSYKP